MSLSWNDIILNREQFADDVKITINGESLTVGEARNALVTKGDLTKVTQREAEARQQMQQSHQAIAMLQQQLAQAASVRGQAPAQTDDELETLASEYPALAPMVSRLKGYESKLQEQVERMQRNELVFNTSQHAMMYDRIKNQDPEFATDDGRNKLVNFALQHGIQRLDLAHQLLTRERDAQKASEKARQDGIEEGKKQARVPHILAGGKRTGHTAHAEPPTNFRDAEEMALQDPEIAAIFHDTSAI